MRCRDCGVEKTEDNGVRIIKNKKHGLLCGRCHQRATKNTEVYKKPNYGEIGYTEEGKIICHICGKAYKKLMLHVVQIHGMTSLEYRKEFGLETGTGIMSEESKKIARKRVYENYDKVVKTNLIEKGRDTRFKDGGPGRTKEQVSEYTRRELVERMDKLSEYRFKKK